MSIIFYSGTPGSGKSLHVARNIYNRLVYAKMPVICSFPVDLNYISKNGKRKIGEFIYLPYEKITPQYFYDYALEHNVKGKESQVLVIIDECQLLFNPREFNRSDRLEWIKFFTQHRHLGYDFILVSQFDLLVDKQIRCLFEFDIKHRKLNNYGIGRFLPFPWFVAATYWYCVRTISVTVESTTVLICMIGWKSQGLRLLLLPRSDRNSLPPAAACNSSPLLDNISLFTHKHGVDF